MSHHQLWFKLGKFYTEHILPVCTRWRTFDGGGAALRHPEQGGAQRLISLRVFSAALDATALLLH
jgi:hypothetical protein